VWRNHYKNTIALRKFWSELTQSLGSLIGSVIRMPHFASLRKSHGKAWLICWTRFSCKGCQSGECWQLLVDSPHLVWLHCMAEELILPLKEDVWSIAGAPSGLIAPDQRGPEKNAGENVIHFPQTAEIPNDSSITGCSLASCPRPLCKGYIHC